jgi:hypothetical protein
MAESQELKYDPESLVGLSSKVSSTDQVIVQACQTLRTNPFTTYRDPKTGRWIVIKSTT